MNIYGELWGIIIPVVTAWFKMWALLWNPPLVFTYTIMAFWIYNFFIIWCNFEEKNRRSSIALCWRVEWRALDRKRKGLEIKNKGSNVTNMTSITHATLAYKSEPSLFLFLFHFAFVFVNVHLLSLFIFNWRKHLNSPISHRHYSLYSKGCGPGDS